MRENQREQDQAPAWVLSVDGHHHQEGKARKRQVVSLGEEVRKGADEPREIDLLNQASISKEAFRDPRGDFREVKPNRQAAVNVKRIGDRHPGSRLR